MKKRILSLLLVLSLVLGLMPGSAFKSTAAMTASLAESDDENYELKVLDFEGDQWDELIDEPQQMGPLLYGDEGTNNGYASEEEAYQWLDKETQLFHVLPYNWGTYCYVGGGHAISNYATADYETYGDYMNQLTVFDAEAGDEIVRSGGGHNDSNNFAMHFGYIDGSPYNLTEQLPTLKFADGEARIIDHMYVNMSVYTLNCLLNGNGLTEPGGSFYVKAIGFNGEERTGEVVMSLSNGESAMITDWTKWDLSELGEVTAVQFNVAGSADNGYGFSQPAYFAYDDVAVRFPAETPAIEIKGTQIPVNDNVIDITDNKFFNYSNVYTGTATKIEILDATVEEAYEDGTTIYVVLGSDTADDATVKTKFQFALDNRVEASGGEGTYTLSGGGCEGTQTVTAKRSSKSGSATYTFIFLKKELPKVVPSAIKVADEVECYQFNDLVINLKEYFADALAYYLVDGETETAIDGTAYSVNTDEVGKKTFVFAAENNIGRADKTVTVTVNVKEIVGGLYIGHTTSNGSLDQITVKSADGNYIEDAILSYNPDTKTIEVKLSQTFDVNGKVKAEFKLTQNGDLPFITTKTGTAGINSNKAVNNKFTEKEITLSNGAATFTFYYYNTTPSTGSNKYETWTLSFKVFNNVPAFVEGVESTVNASISAGENCTTDLSGLYEDKDGETLTYQVSVDNGAWTNIEGSEYSYSNDIAGNYVLKFRAFDGMDYSEDIYTVNISVSDAETTYDVYVNLPETYDVQFYAVKDISGGIVEKGANLTVEENVVKVPSNVDIITWTFNDLACGTAAVSENAQLDIKAVKFTAKTLLEEADTAATIKVTDANGAAMTVGETGIALLATGSGYTYNVKPGISGWNAVTLENQTVSNEEVVIVFEIAGKKSVTAPKDAEVTVYYQNGNYKGEYVNPVYSTENKDDNTITYYYSCTKAVGNTSASGYVYRAVMKDKITKAGYLNAVNDAVVSWSENDKTPEYRGAGEEEANYIANSKDTQRRAGDNVMMTLNESGHLVLSSTKDLGIFRNWDIINTDTENVAIEPDFHFEVVAGDENIVTITDLNSAYGNNWQRLTKNGDGTAVIEVRFDAIHIVDGYEAGGWGGAYGHMSDYTYNASNPYTTGLFVVQTDGKAASDVTFNIASDRKTFSRQWDAEVDTYYILEETGKLTLTPTAASGIESVEVSNDKGDTWSTLEAADGVYTADVVEGNNIIRVTNGEGKTAYQVVRALKLDLKIENVTDSSKGEEFAAGDIVKLYITGLISPIGKMGGIYNPQAVQGAFTGSDGNSYTITGPGGVTGSYAFNGRTYYIENIIIPDSGVLVLDGLRLVQNGFNLTFGKHRGITMAGTGGAAGGAEGSSGASVLPIVTLKATDHEHVYAEDWKTDADQHWKECGCGDKKEAADHTFEWVIDKEATASETGLKHEECTVCHAKRNENTEIPVIEEISSLFLTITANGESLEVISLGERDYISGVWKDPCKKPMFSVKIPANTDFVIAPTETGDGAAGTTRNFHLATGESMQGSYPYTMTESNLEYYVLNAEDFEYRVGTETGVDTSNKLAFIEVRDTNSNQLYVILAEVIGDEEEGGDDTEITNSVITAETLSGTSLKVYQMGTENVKGADVPVLYIEIPAGSSSVKVIPSGDYKVYDDQGYFEENASNLSIVPMFGEWYTLTKDYGRTLEYVIKFVEETPEHEHQPGTEWKYDETEHWKECECTEKLEAADHTFEWVTDKEATEFEAGIKHEECTVCHVKRSENTEIPATHVHAYGEEWKTDADKHWKECACKDQKDAAEHTFEWVIDKEAAEFEAGIKHEECTVCHAKRNENTEIPAPIVPTVEEVVRLFGDSRYDTGYAVADAYKEVLGVEKFEAVVVATGKNFADALAGSYLAVEKNAPILLTNGKDDNVAQLHAYIAANVAEGGKVYILGGQAAVPEAVEAIEGYDVVRLFGDSRYDTNLEILAETGITGDSIIVATAKTFADSLSASAAKLPILLVKPNAALNDAQKAVLEGMKNIYIVGGEGAVSAAYAEELAAYGTVTRVYGDSRYDTSVEIAKTFCKDADEAVVASGKNFPDGLCGGPLAAALNAPLVLTKDSGADAAAGYIADNAIESGYVLGGTGALADETVIEVFALTSADEIK